MHGVPSPSNERVTHKQPSCPDTLVKLHHTGLSRSLQNRLTTSSCGKGTMQTGVLPPLSTEPLISLAVHPFIHCPPTLPPLNLKKIMVIINAWKVMALCMWFTSSSPPLFSGILLPPLQHFPPKSTPTVHLACMPEGLVLTCRRRSHRCRPHRENSPPHGYPAKGDKEKNNKPKPCNSPYVKKPNQEIILTRGLNLSFALSPPLHCKLHFLRPKRAFSNSPSLSTALLLNSGTSHSWTQ